MLNSIAEQTLVQWHHTADLRLFMENQMCCWKRTAVKKNYAPINSGSKSFCNLLLQCTTTWRSVPVCSNIWCHVQTYESVNALVTFACMHIDVLRANERGLQEKLTASYMDRKAFDRQLHNPTQPTAPSNPVDTLTGIAKGTCAPIDCS